MVNGSTGDAHQLRRRSPSGAAGDARGSAPSPGRCAAAAWAACDSWPRRWARGRSSWRAPAGRCTPIRPLHTRGIAHRKTQPQTKQCSLRTKHCSRRDDSDQSVHSAQGIPASSTESERVPRPQANSRDARPLCNGPARTTYDVRVSHVYDWIKSSEANNWGLIESFSLLVALTRAHRREYTELTSLSETVSSLAITESTVSLCAQVTSH